MSMGRFTKRSAVTGALLALTAAALAAAGTAGTLLAEAKCGNPKLEPLGKSLGIRGYLACSDGATASVRFQGAPYKFGSTSATSGVCWKDSRLPLNVDIGTVVHDRKKSDAPGLAIVLVKPGTVTTHTVDFGLAKAGKVIKWNGPIVVKQTSKLAGTFKDAVYGGIVNGKPKWTASGKIVSGSYSCKRILVVPT